jgi:predicted metal-binding membrane protein
LRSLGLFVAVWVVMMAAMILPGAIPAVLHLTYGSARVGRAAMFLGSYLVVWALVGVVVYALYRPHGTSVAGAVVVAAGVYELTPVKRHCRRRYRESVDSGFGFSAYCVGSSIGLMS